jgi:MoxR-like ATPase
MTASTPNTTTAPAGITLNIETGLINKKEVFRMIALAQATGLPLLLVGHPGVAKTRTVLDYTTAWLKNDHKAGEDIKESLMNKVYILETDEGTKSSEVKGMPDLQKLLQENTYELSTPIATASVVVVNEVDKASSNIRNSFLGVMNEKMLFNGKFKIKCAWDIFIATCNEIPKDEVGSPFWDRFMLKMEVNRVTQGELSDYYGKGGRKYRESNTIYVPTKAEIDAVDIAGDKLEKFLDVAYKSLSDRTLTHVPLIAQTIKLIWGFTMNQALVKTCEILVPGTAKAAELNDKLTSPEMKIMLNKVEMIQTLKTKNEVNAALEDLEQHINQYARDKKIDKPEVDELSQMIHKALQDHPTKNEVDALAKATADINF